MDSHKNRSIVLIGQKYGRLTIIEDLGSVLNYGLYRTSVRTICDCGKEYIGFLTIIKSGATHSCGCLRRDLAKEWGKARKFKHGHSAHPLMRVWDGMMQRCNNPNNKYYYNYGGRGITTCSEWKESYISFYTWAISNGWEKGLELDRRENDKNYTPFNCRFVTSKVNNRNKRSNHTVSYKGQTMCLTEWAEKIGISASALNTRIQRWGLEKAMTTKPMTQYARY